jgi:hypothetical protein
MKERVREDIASEQPYGSRRRCERSIFCNKQIFLGKFVFQKLVAVQKETVKYNWMMKKSQLKKNGTVFMGLLQIV